MPEDVSDAVVQVSWDGGEDGGLGFADVGEAFLCDGGAEGADDELGCGHFAVGLDGA